MKKLIVAALAAAGLAAPAAAQTFYAEGGYQMVQTEVDLTYDTADLDYGAIVVRGGYMFTENFGLEAEVGFGVQDDDVNGVDVKLNHLAGVFGRGQVPLNDTINLFARAGVVSGKLEADGAGWDEVDSETGWAVGAGADVFFSDNLGLSAGYTHYDVDNVDADAFSVTFKFRK